MTKASITPPSPFLLLAEGRAIGEFLTSALILPALRRGTKGDGHPVMVLPGFLGNGLSTLPLRPRRQGRPGRPSVAALGQGLRHVLERLRDQAP